MIKFKKIGPANYRFLIDKNIKIRLFYINNEYEESYRKTSNDDSA